MAVAAYDIYRDGSLLVSIGTTTNYTDTSVSPASTYLYQLRARDAVGNLSDPSNDATVTTPPDTTPPTTPTNLNAVATGWTQIDLTWDESNDDVVSPCLSRSL